MYWQTVQETIGVIVMVALGVGVIGFLAWVIWGGVNN